MLNKLREFLSFNAAERNGIIVLLILILMAAVAPRIYRYFRKPEIFDASAFILEIQKCEQEWAADSISRAASLSKGKEQKSDAVEPSVSELFPFNPNSLPPEKWKKLGLKDWQIRIIQKYESRGGSFRKKDDLKKIYGMKDELYEKLAPYITLPESLENADKQNARFVNPAKSTLMVDLNTADTSMLMKLKGIGPSFARRIVKYRDLLGGFYRKEQLLEVYGFDQQRLTEVANSCETGAGPFRKLHLNTSSLDEFRKHPYLDYFMSKAIIDRRIARGKYTRIDQLRELPAIPPETLEKLSAYLLCD